MIFLRSSFLKHLKALDFSDEFVEISEIENIISLRSGIPMNSFTIFYNGKLMCLSQKVPQDSTIDVCFSLTGGKGGFGSMLRAIGAQIEKTTNREACRDLSGRRLRDINEEQRLKQWLSKKAEREAEQLKRRKEKLERLKQMPKHEFHDPEYNKERSELPERIDDALSQGLRKANRALTSKAQGSHEPPSKKKRRWLDDEISSDSEEDGQSSLHQSLGESSKSGQTSSSDSVDYTDAQIAAQNAANATSSVQMDVDCDQGEFPTRNENPATSEESQETKSTTGEESQKPKSDTGEESQKTKSDNGEESQKTKSDNGEESNKAKTVTDEELQKENIATGEKIQGAKTVTTENQPHGESLSPCVRGGEEEQTKKTFDLPSDSEPSIQLASGENEEALDLLQFHALSELEGLGLERLKTVLTNMGLKCGGTLAQRAERLWSVRGKDPKDYPQSLRVKKKS